VTIKPMWRVTVAGVASRESARAAHSHGVRCCFGRIAHRHVRSHPSGRLLPFCDSSRGQKSPGLERLDDATTCDGRAPVRFIALFPMPARGRARAHPADLAWLLRGLLGLVTGVQRKFLRLRARGYQAGFSAGGCQPSPSGSPPNGFPQGVPMIVTCKIV
jgi:hypothetical protein